MQRRTRQDDTHMWIHKRWCCASVLLGEAERGDRRQEGGGKKGRTAREGCREAAGDGWMEGGREGGEMRRDAREVAMVVVGQWEGWVVLVNIYIALWYARQWKRETGKAEKGGIYRASIPLLILFRTAKFSIQHVSPVMERGREGGEKSREKGGRERGWRLLGDGAHILNFNKRSGKEGELEREREREERREGGRGKERDRRNWIHVEHIYI